MDTKEYIAHIVRHYASGKSTEHTYRGDLQNIIAEFGDGVTVTNEPKHQQCGAPDYIDDTQYFDKMPRAAWAFYIGGYQPAQKWLKDRKERVLSYEDIRHYQKMIVAMTETERIMWEIDVVGII